MKRTPTDTVEPLPDIGEYISRRDIAAILAVQRVEEPQTNVEHVLRQIAESLFYGTVREETDNNYGNNYLQAEAIIGKLMQHYNEKRLHATLGYMTPVTWHRGQPEEVRNERAPRIERPVRNVE